MGQRRSGPRYGVIRGGNHPAMVVRDGPGEIPAGPTTTDHRRWRRQQWVAGPAVETRIAEAGPATHCCRRHGSRVRLWKLELQKLADETGLAIAVSHFPPGTSKWNKIEHRLFSFISKNWRGQPLTSLKVIVSLIAGTTTRKGLRVHAEIDDRRYPAGIKVPDAEMAQIHLRRD